MWNSQKKVLKKLFILESGFAWHTQITETKSWSTKKYTLYEKCIYVIWKMHIQCIICVIWKMHIQHVICNKQENLDRQGVSDIHIEALSFYIHICYMGYEILKKAAFCKLCYVNRRQRWLLRNFARWRGAWRCIRLDEKS